MANKGKIVIGIFGLIIMIVGIAWFVGSVNNLNSDLSAIENKKVVCDNWKIELDQQKSYLEKIDLTEETVNLFKQYNTDVIEYSKGCLQ